MKELLENREIYRICELLVELPPVQRHKYLESLTLKNSALAENVKELLNAYQQNIIDDKGKNTKHSIQSTPIFNDIEQYTIIKCIGSGGMGNVFLAERKGRTSVDTVAIKFIRQDKFNEKLYRNFEREREILDRLDHPNITNLLDSGTTPEGLPYYVMEYIQGKSLIEYCNNNDLTTRERLTLFMDICSGVCAAHKNLVIHRDLKPSNIIVSDNGVPKLLDFGIAKDLLHDTKSTIRLLSPAYASPEQIRGENLTTSTDIYSLGVILFELLTNHIPFNVEDPLELIKKAYPHYAISYNTSRHHIQFKKLIGRDLNCIVMKAMHSDIERRYASVQQLNEDIESFLKNRPISAQRDSLLYRGKCFIKRNWAMTSVTSAALITIALSLGIQQSRIIAERDLVMAESEKLLKTKNFLIELFNNTVPTEASGNKLTASELLGRGVEQLNRELKNQPEVKSDLMNTIGIAYKNLGLYDKAEPLLQESLELKFKHYPKDSEEIANSLNENGALLVIQSNFQQALQFHEQALEIYKKKHAGDHPEIAHTYKKLGDVYFELGKYETASKYFKKAKRLDSKHFGDNSNRVAELNNQLGRIYLDKGEFDQAIIYLEQALAVRVDLFGEDHASIVDPLGNLGISWERKGEYDKALAYYERALEIMLTLFGNEHPKIAIIYNNIGVVWHSKEDFVKASQYIGKALAIDMKVYGEDHPILAIRHSNLGEIWRRRGEYDKAIQYAELALSSDLNSFGKNHPNIAIRLSNLGRVWHDKGKFDIAIKYFKQALSIDLKNFGDNHPRVAARYFYLATAYVEKEEFQIAELYFQNAYKIRIDKLGKNHPLTIGIVDEQKALQKKIQSLSAL